MLEDIHSALVRLSDLELNREVGLINRQNSLHLPGLVARKEVCTTLGGGLDHEGGLG